MKIKKRVLLLGDAYPRLSNLMFMVQMLFIQNLKVMKKVKHHLNQIIHILFLLMMELNVNMKVQFSFVLNLKEPFYMYKLRQIIIQKKINQVIISRIRRIYSFFSHSDRIPVVIVVIEGCSDAIKKGLVISYNDTIDSSSFLVFQFMKVLLKIEFQLFLLKVQVDVVIYLLNVITCIMDTSQQQNYMIK